MLPEYRVLDLKLEHLLQEEVRELQTERLKAQAHHCYENAPFWRRKFDKAGITPDDIKTVEDLPKIPFCTKEDLQKDQEENPPYGSYLCVHPSRLTQYMATSGTTGRPVVRVFTQRDWDHIIQRFQRDPHLDPGEIVMVLGPTDGLMGPTAGVAGWSSLGALVVKAARFSTQDKVKLIHQLKPPFVIATASFLLYLAEVAEQMDMAFPRMGGVRIVASVGEPGGAIPATRERLLKSWGAKYVQDGYGITELFPLGDSCQGSPSLHIANDFVITEVIDTETGRVLGPGQRGELVFTNIIGETQPLLRYRTRDVGAVAEFGPCPACGATSTRIVNGIEGRSDDMVWYKGINIFPTAVEAVVRSFDELSNEFEIVLDQKGTAQTLTIRAEVIPQVAPDDYGRLGQQLGNRLLEALEGVHAQVELLPEGTLPKTQYKGKRVKDNRPR